MSKNRIDQEKRVVELMIRLHCRKKEKNVTLCPQCEELFRYAHVRLDRCPFGEKKKACKQCSVHCYKPVMWERTKQVMCFSGPRMLIYAPWEAIRHLFGQAGIEKNIIIIIALLLYNNYLCLLK